MNSKTTQAVRGIALAVFAAVLFSNGLTGCSTVAGVGEDMEAAGDAIQDKANEEKNY